MSAHKCEGVVWTVESYRSHRCNKNAAHEHEGHWFCKTHHPPSIEAKNDARSAKWKAELDAQNVANKAESAAKAEQKRRADCYPDLLAALEEILPWIPKTSASEGGASSFSENVRAADKVRAAIAKATGVPPCASAQIPLVAKQQPPQN
jgi:hypothetical protein